MASRTTAGVLVNARTGTGRDTLPIKELPSLTMLFITITGTATLDLEVSDDDVNYFAVATITGNSLVQFAIPASVLAINTTAVSGSVTVKYRTTSLENIPAQTLLIFDDSTVTVESPIEQNVAIKGNKSAAYKKLAQAQPGITPTTLYTVPASTQTIIPHIRVSNPTGTDRTIELWHDGNADSNSILPPVTVVAGGWAEFDGRIYMETGDTLQAEASAATALTVTVYGEELTSIT